MLKIDIPSITRTSWLRKREQLAAKMIALFCAVLMPLFSLSWTTAQAHEVLLNTVAEVYFSPKGGCTEAIVLEINRAKSEILVQAYSFTSKEIAEALADAHTRGVSIQIILDKSQIMARLSAAAYASQIGIPTFIDRAHAIAHNKVMIIDKLMVITGSFNFTKAAEEGNAENLLIVRSSALARLYRELERSPKAFRGLSRPRCELVAAKLTATIPSRLFSGHLKLFGVEFSSSCGL